MDELEQRFKETADACIKSFESWVSANKDLSSREKLMETMHELRKVISRVEVEIAISERDHLGTRPLPIPPHRSSRKQSNPDEMDFGQEEREGPMPVQGGGGNRRGGLHRGGRRPHPRPNENAGGGGQGEDA